MTLESSLIKQTKGRLGIRYPPGTQQGCDFFVEVSVPDLELALWFFSGFIGRGLVRDQTLKDLDLFCIQVAEEELAEPTWATFDDQLGSPGVRGLVRLWTSEAIDIGTMMRDLN